MTSDQRGPLSVRAEAAQPAPLSKNQRALLASHRRSPALATQNMSLLTHIEAAIDVDRWAAAFARVVMHADVLRTVVDREGAASIVPVPPAATEVVTMTRTATAEWAVERASTPIDPSVSAYDSVLIKHEDNTTSWFCTLHHLATDAQSFATMLRETARAYEGHSPQVTSYYDWMAGVEGAAARAEAAVAYWDERPCNDRVSRLYSHRSASAGKTARLPVQLEEEVAAKLEQQLSGPYKMLTPQLASTSLLVAAAALYTHYLSGASELSIGIPIHNRRTPSDHLVIGPLMELFPISVTIDQNDTFQALADRTARALKKTLRHAKPGTSPEPDFDVVVNVIPDSGVHEIAGHAATVEWLASGSMDADHLLRVQLTGYGDAMTPSGFGEGTSLHLDLAESVATASAQRRAAQHFGEVLAQFADDPLARIDAGLICADDELKELEQWGTGEPAADAPLLAPRLRSALSGNDSVVLVDGELQLTGQELLEWSLALASQLEPHRRVAIELTPSAHAIVAIYAAILAGSSFVPLDPSHPEARRERLRAAAEVSLVLDADAAVNASRGQAPLHPAAALPTGDPKPGDPKPGDPKPGDEAYVIFTSGSTGEPKGVPITHQGLANYISFAEQSYFTDGPPVAALFGSLSFDLTITTIFAPLLRGGVLHVIRDVGPAAITTLARNPQITWCKATPSHLEMFLKFVEPEHQLRTIVVGGEAFSTRLARDLEVVLPEVSIFNEYGPTEAVVGCMIHRFDAERSAGGLDVPIGVPAPAVSLRIVDHFDNPTPVGACGELLISHREVTDGYINVPSDDRFVIIDGQRYYRSGDLVQIDEGGLAIFRGRVDEQMKVGGIRLDPIEVEEALNLHPDVRRSVVRLWAPETKEPTLHCARCGLPNTVPGVGFDDQQVCDTCHTFDRVEVATRSWFKTPEDLVAIRDRARQRSQGPYDCLAMLSGGKDSTFALHQLVEHGFRPYAFTLDNGFISEGAKANVRRTAEALGIEHEFASTPAMNDILRDSLATFSNVCNGCYKTIYTLAVNRAAELDIPLIVTGLSRGQLFETRLVPEQFRLDRFDPDSIDRTVLQARKNYHRSHDLPNQLLDTEIFATDDVFEQIEFVDIFRYLDVELDDMLTYLDEKTPWKRPADTGRSTNCLVNVAGIHTHLTEQGYHNYAVPYAWDVRLGHKTRDEAIAELEDNITMDEVDPLLATLAYSPNPRTVLTAWVELNDPEAAPEPAALRNLLATSLPAHAIPAAFVSVDTLPMTANGKLDVAALPEPQRVHRNVATGLVAPVNDLERTILELWERELGIEPIGAEDDFFSLGGDSLAALSTIVQLGASLRLELDESLAFVHTTPRALAAAIDLDGPTVQQQSPTGLTSDPVTFAATLDPTNTPFSLGEQSVLFEQRSRPSSVAYNLGRIFHIPGTVDAGRLTEAVVNAAAQRDTLTSTYGTPRRPIAPARAVDIRCIDHYVEPEQAAKQLGLAHREPFDLVNGPLARCVVQPRTDGTTDILLAAHHVTCDLDSLSVLWSAIDGFYSGSPQPTPQVSYAAFSQWQEQDEHLALKGEFWLDQMASYKTTALLPLTHSTEEPDGFLRRSTNVRPAALLQRTGASPSVLATAAAGAALSPFFAGGVVPLNLVASTRTDSVADDLFGYLLNPVPIQLETGAADDISSVVADATAEIGAVLAARDYPVARRVADAREAGIELPTENVLVSVDLHPTASFGEHEVTHQALFNGSAVADLSFFVEVRDSFVEVGLEYRGVSVGGDRAEQIIDRFSRALEAAVADDALQISELSRLETVSVAQGESLPSTELVLSQIMHNAKTRPSAVAVECADETLRWSDLADRSETIARQLIDQGVTAGDRVAVCLPRSTNLLAALVGVQLAGAAYVPIDPTYPADRIALISDTAQAQATLVAPGHAGPVFENSLVISPDGVGGVSWTPATFTLPMPAPTTNAYLIFTSGSTGVPSGVAVSHEQLAASTNARRDVYVASPERFCVLSSVAFDSSIVGIFWSLASGGTVVLPTDRQARDVDALASLLASVPLTHILGVPTMYRALLARSKPSEHWPGHVIVAGESCPPSLVDEHVAKYPNVALTNEYGPTEATVWATAHRCSPGENPVPIGKPIPGTWVAVVDGDGVPVPEDVPGELIIGGAGLTGGYVNNETLTAKRFASADRTSAQRFLPDGRFFRSGDRASMRNGVVFFAGRIDEQLNVGGARVEPAEVEAVLQAHDEVVAVAVVAQDVRSFAELCEAAPAVVVHAAKADLAAASTLQERTAAVNPLRTYGDPDVRLVAHLEASSELDPVSLRQGASAALPVALRPSVYVTHGRLPRSPAGKVDRAASAQLEIPETSVSAATSPTARPGSHGAVQERTQLILNIFRSQLRNRDIVETDSFFDQGGNSLRAIDVLNEIEQSLGVEVSTSTIFEYPTAAGLANQIRGGVTAKPDSKLRSLVIPVNSTGTATPIFAVHHLGPNAELFRPLAELLGPDQPLYGLAAPLPLEPFGKADYNIEIEYNVATIATTYVAEVERLAPTGPVVIAGTCQGALFAYEVAQQLRAKGRDVPLLAMFTDWHAPLVEYSDAQTVLIRKKLTLLRENGLASIRRVLSVRGPRLRVQRKAEIIALRGFNRAGMRLPERLRVRHYIEQSLDHFNAYAYEPYDGSALVVRGSDDRRISEADQTAGWGDLIADLEITFVPGWGMTILAEPNIRKTAAAFQAALEGAARA